jgi:hypothetical protein
MPTKCRKSPDGTDGSHAQPYSDSLAPEQLVAQVPDAHGIDLRRPHLILRQTSGQTLTFSGFMNDNHDVLEITEPLRIIKS